jgi:lauroyl/myristoyl acyltransferase
MPMDLAGRGVESIPLPFLGQSARIPTGPARLALATGASLVIGTPRVAVGGYEIEIEAMSSADWGGEQVEPLTQALIERLERRIRDLPDRWIWMNGSS